MKYFDTHCHLNHVSFNSDIEEVLQRAVDSGIEKIIVPGWDLDSSQVAVNLSEKYPQIYAAVGIHPSECLKIKAQMIGEIRKLASHPRVVAIGEIGLDYYYEPVNKEQQKHLLLEMLEIAGELKKRIIIHSRQSMVDISPIIIKWISGLSVGEKGQLNFPVIFHAYEGNLENASAFLAYHCLFGVGGPITYKNSKQKIEVFSSLPDDSILLETDAPYLPPDKHRGDRNEPSFLPMVVNKLAELRHQDPEDLTNRIFENSYKMVNEELVH